MMIEALVSSTFTEQAQKYIQVKLNFQVVQAQIKKYKSLIWTAEDYLKWTNMDAKLNEAMI